MPRAPSPLVALVALVALVGLGAVPTPSAASAASSAGAPSSASAPSAASAVPHPSGARATPSASAAPATSADGPAAASPDDPDDTAWCAPELTELGGGRCAFTAPGAGDTLVVFLHGLVAPRSGWQLNQQRAIVRAARRHRFTALAPRAVLAETRHGWHWGWPTGAAAQREHEAALLAGWRAAREELEARRGAPFARTLVFGFSSGAYYAAGLALRDAFPADGYAVFAGGGAPARLKRQHLPARRPPLYVGWGLRDKAHRDPAGLLRALRGLGWPVRGGGRAKVGHSMTDAQVAEAWAFLTPRRR